MKKQFSSDFFGVIGLGRFGTALVQCLAEAGKEVVAIDSNESRVKEIRKYTDYAYVVDVLDNESLEEMGIQNCDTVIVCIGEQLDISVLTTMLVVGLGVPHVIAKATSIVHGAILEKLGAEVVYPERDMAIRLANRLEISRMLDVVQLSEQLNITKMHVPAQMINKTVVEVNLRSRFNLNIIAIENNGKVIEVVRPDYVFRADDILFLSGSREDIVKLNNWINK